jgi:Zn-finger nucleic acid-binding protein
MKLVACSHCHAQYDVTNLGGDAFPCHCGHAVQARPADHLERAVHRCGACGALLEGEAEQCEYCRAAVVREKDGPSLICPECYARNAQDCRYCTACGVAFQPQPLPGSLQEWPCPCCGVLMPARQVGGVPLSECPHCHGLWVPDGQLDSLVQRAIEARKQRVELGGRSPRPRASGANPAAAPVTYRKCPVCEAFMLRQNYERRSGVILDVCKKHGSWLDADELEQIGGFILSGGLTEARAREGDLDRQEERRRRAQQTALGSTLHNDPRELTTQGWVLELLHHLFS